MLKRMMIYGLYSPITPPVGDLIVLNNWQIQNMDIINGNDFRPNAGDARAYSPTYLPVGGIGEIRGRSNISIFGLDQFPALDPYTSLDFAVWRNGGGYPSTYNNNDEHSEYPNPVPVGSQERVRCTGTLIYFEASTDDWLTWANIIPPVAQIQQKLYPKIATDPGEYLDDVFVSSSFITD